MNVTVRMRGFTLLELMIVVAVIAVLAAIAYPSYSRYAYRARRADAQNLLMSIANGQERYYSSYNKYTSDVKDLGYSSGTASSENGHYTASIDLDNTNGVGQGYTAEAAPQGIQTSDACGTLSVTNAGAKTYSGNETNGKCW